MDALLRDGVRASVVRQLLVGASVDFSGRRHLEVAPVLVVAHDEADRPTADGTILDVVLQLAAPGIDERLRGLAAMRTGQ